MSKKFSVLRNRMSPAARAQSDLEFRQLMTQMPLHELRKARDLSQVKLAEVLQVNQASIAPICTSARFGDISAPWEVICKSSQSFRKVKLTLRISLKRLIATLLSDTSL
jgi:transcriptional regulator with XRE-family HTH domain